MCISAAEMPNSLCPPRLFALLLVLCYTILCYKLSEFCFPPDSHLLTVLMLCPTFSILKYTRIWEGGIKNRQRRRIFCFSTRVLPSRPVSWSQILGAVGSRTSSALLCGLRAGLVGIHPPSHPSSFLHWGCWGQWHCTGQ